MPMAPLPLIALLMFTLAGCVHEPAPGQDTVAGEEDLYLPPPPGVVGGELRTLFVEPLTLSPQWEITAAQRKFLQDALVRAAQLNWRDDAVKSLLLVGDAPPHDRDIPQTWLAAEHLRAERVHGG